MKHDGTKHSTTYHACNACLWNVFAPEKWWRWGLGHVVGGWHARLVHKNCHTSPWPNTPTYHTHIKTVLKGEIRWEKHPVIEAFLEGCLPECCTKGVLGALFPCINEASDTGLRGVGWVMPCLQDAFSLEDESCSWEYAAVFQMLKFTSLRFHFLVPALNAYLESLVKCFLFLFFLIILAENISNFITSPLIICVCVCASV